jgi:hypothetical protein
MKTKIVRLIFLKIILPIFLIPLFIPATDAQTLTVQYQFTDRRVINNFYASDSHGGAYQPYFVAFTNVDGTFNFSDTESAPIGFYYVSASSTASQNSTIASTATNLSITGQMEISASGSAVADMSGEGAASWSDLSEMIVGFTVDRPFTYSLQVTTTMSTNSAETVPVAVAGIDDHGDVVASLPDIVAYGGMAYPGGFATTPSASGTGTGVLTNGTYYFIARVHSESLVNPNNTPAAEEFAVTFNLNVAYAPQAPVIVAFAPNGAGAFNLIWNAPQAGNYRVLSSTNLTTWSELIPAAAQPLGLNTNAISAIPSSDQGFFRIEYLP